MRVARGPPGLGTVGTWGRQKPSLSPQGELTRHPVLAECHVPVHPPSPNKLVKHAATCVSTEPGPDVPIKPHVKVERG